MFRSKVSHIQLAAITKSEYLKKYGANTILKPIVEDIKKLVSDVMSNVRFSYILLLLYMYMYIGVRVYVSDQRSASM